MPLLNSVIFTLGALRCGAPNPDDASASAKAKPTSTSRRRLKALIPLPGRRARTGRDTSGRRDVRDDQDDESEQTEADADPADDDPGDRHAATLLSPARLVDLVLGDVPEYDADDEADTAEHAGDRT